MARITIEDCMEQIPNRFQLVRMASIRAKQLKKGARPLIENTENKAVVTSLREIAAGVVKPGDAELPPEPTLDTAAYAASTSEEVTTEAAPAEAAPVVGETPEPTPEG